LAKFPSLEHIPPNEGGDRETDGERRRERAGERRSGKGGNVF
jgi:hypothetical protein